MQNFRHYLCNKLSSDSFRKEYEASCCACAVTAEIFRILEQRQIPREQVCARCGIDTELLNEMETADNCDPESVRKIADFLEIPYENTCRRMAELE
jgi:hypothetical protein